MSVVISSNRLPTGGKAPVLTTWSKLKVATVVLGRAPGPIPVTVTRSGAVVRPAARAVLPRGLPHSGLSISLVLSTAPRRAVPVVNWLNGNPAVVGKRTLTLLPLTLVRPVPEMNCPSCRYRRNRFPLAFWTGWSKLYTTVPLTALELVMDTLIRSVSVPAARP